MFATQSFAQTGFRYVPDSLTCLTPAQDVFFINQSYTINDLSTSLVLKNKELLNKSGEILALRNEVKEGKLAVNLRIQQNNHLNEDKVFLEKQLNIANKGKRIARTGFVVMASVAVLELGYIGLLRITR